jgi:hypothetical protein
MSKKGGFLQHRRGIWQHVRDGRMSLQDVAVHQYIAAQADTRTGVWNGSAGALAGELCLSPRVARRFLERLSRGDYIRRFPVPGKHVCYPILSHKFEPTNGEHRGEQLDAINSINPMELRYVPIKNGEHGGEQEGEHLSSQMRMEKREKRKEKNPAAKTTPLADPRFQPFVDFAYETFEEKHCAKPSWLAKDFKHLQLLLSANAGLSLEELKSRWRSYLATTEIFILKQGSGLAYFSDHCDTFAGGPILGRRDHGTVNRNGGAVPGVPGKYSNLPVTRFEN